VRRTCRRRRCQAASVGGIVNGGAAMSGHPLCSDRRGRRAMIRKLSSGQYRLYSRKRDPDTGRRRNLGTFRTRAAAERHERAVQFFKRRG
jgi:hypothetical protein